MSPRGFVSLAIVLLDLGIVGEVFAARRDGCFVCKECAVFDKLCRNRRLVALIALYYELTKGRGTRVGASCTACLKNSYQNTICVPLGKSVVFSAPLISQQRPRLQVERR